MARLHVMERSHAQAVMDDLHDALGRRLAVSSLAPCPVEFTAALVNLCSTQSCGKCTPCRVGLSALSDLLADVLEGRADESTREVLRRTYRDERLTNAEKIAAVKRIYDRLDVRHLTEQQISLRFDRALAVLGSLSVDPARTLRMREYAESLVDRKK